MSDDSSLGPDHLRCSRLVVAVTGSAHLLAVPQHLDAFRRRFADGIGVLL